MPPRRHRGYPGGGFIENKHSDPNRSMPYLQGECSHRRMDSLHGGQTIVWQFTHGVVFNIVNFGRVFALNDHSTWTWCSITRRRAMRRA